MKEHLPPAIPEHPPAVDDNARKFITKRLPGEFLSDHHARSFRLNIDWLETDEEREQKLAHKTYADGTTEIRHITKTTDQAGNRSSTKPPISLDRYLELLPGSLCHLEKDRYEFTYRQQGVNFSCTYDEFIDADLCMLEVDASDEQTRSLFDPTDFSVALHEVTGDLRYYGYRVTAFLSQLR